METTFAYVGGELELFEKAVRWKRYVGGQIKEHLVGSVLEVGAGRGAATRVFLDGRQSSWVCLEPDPELSGQLEAQCRDGELPALVEVVRGTLADLGTDRKFDCILYMDVLEHIENDADELNRASQLLRPGGALIVLAPAHQGLFSEFDRAIGHFRRYSKASLAGAAPKHVRLTKLRYLDAAGVAASWTNRLLLRRALPTARQLRFWDGVLVTLSRVVDPLTGYRLGKSVLGVWRAPS